MSLAALLLAAAQAPSAGPPPADAAALLAWHLDLEGPATDAEEARWRTYRYVAAGAAGEARAAAAVLGGLDGGIRDSHRYAIEVDCWSPLTWEQGHVKAERWLADFADAPEEERAAVARLRDWLGARVDARAAIETRRGAVVWAPLAALAALVLLFLGVRRATRPTA